MTQQKPHNDPNKKKYEKTREKFSEEGKKHPNPNPDQGGHTEQGGRGKIFPNEDKRGAESE